jgi:alpha-L-fucosidase 2
LPLPPDQVIAMRITASVPNQLNCSFSFDGELQIDTKSIGSDRLLFTGKAPAHVEASGRRLVHQSNAIGEGMYCAVALHLIVDDGSILPGPNGLTVSNATGFTVLLCSATGYRSFSSMPNIPLAEVVAKVEHKLDSAQRRGFENLKTWHIADYGALFHRVSFYLGAQDLAIPTDQRLANFATSRDLSLVALYFQYSRYLLISSSRPGSQPANLQGIWNEKVAPPWGGNWTIGYQHSDELLAGGDVQS